MGTLRWPSAYDDNLSLPHIYKTIESTHFLRIMRPRGLTERGAKSLSDYSGNEQSVIECAYWVYS